MNDGGVSKTTLATPGLLNINNQTIQNYFGLWLLKKFQSHLVTVSRGVISGLPFTGCKVSLLSVSLGFSDWLNSVTHLTNVLLRHTKDIRSRM